MSILRSLAIKSLRLNRKRTISTIIGIILSCSLICAVATMVTSFQATLVENAVNETGYYHLKLENVENEDLEEVKQNSHIQNCYTTTEVGYGKLPEGQNEDKPYLKLYAMDKILFDYLHFDLLEGNFPRNEKEVVISQHISENGKVDYQIGDKVKLAIGVRKTKEGENLQATNPYQEEKEELIQSEDYEFTVVGIMKRPSYDFEAYGDPGYTIITTKMEKGRKQAYLSLKKPKEYKTVIPEILGASNYKDMSQEENLKYEGFEVNRELLRWEVFAFSDSTVKMLWSVAGVVLVIILFTSVFCIRNSFAIATKEKIKMYGMLASVGATKKQMKRMVMEESFSFGLVAIPIGIVSGIMAVFVLIKIVNHLLGDYLLSHVDGIVVKISFLPIILTILLGMLTIYLSAISSARRASKVSPIDLVRNSNEIKIKGKKLKTPQIIRKCFKIGGELAFKNLKRSKKKYRTTVISLAVSIFIFITMNSFLVNMFDFSSNYYEDFEYNMMFYCRGEEKEEIEAIRQMKNVDACFVLYENAEYLKIKDKSKINEIPGFELMEDVYYDEEAEKFIASGEGELVKLGIVALEHETFDQYVKKIGFQPEKRKKTGILCDNYSYYDETGKQIETRRYRYAVGDTIIGELNGEEIHFPVGAVTDKKPYGLEKTYYEGGYLVLDLDEYPEVDFSPCYMNIQSSDTNALIEEIKDAKLDMNYSNFEESAKREKAMVLVIKIFLYGFIAVITLIGVTNIFNTITSNMELRQKEFATLKSIGMTKKEFNNMIYLETIFYATKALLYGIVLGLLGTLALYRAFSVKIEMGMYWPIEPIFISIVAVFILVFVIMKYSMVKINRQNTIETIRKENI